MDIWIICSFGYYEYNYYEHLMQIISGYMSSFLLGKYLE